MQIVWVLHHGEEPSQGCLSSNSEMIAEAVCLLGECEMGVRLCKHADKQVCLWGKVREDMSTKNKYKTNLCPLLETMRNFGFKINVNLSSLFEKIKIPHRHHLIHIFSFPVSLAKYF